MSINNSYRGMKNRAQGELFENSINAACKYYEMANVASIKKTPEPMKVIRNMGTGMFTAVFTKRAQPDYKGILFGGQGIMFDAKHTEQERIQQSALSEEQTTELLTNQKFGGLSFVVVNLDLVTYRVPIDIWVDMKRLYGRKYMTANELMEYKVPFENGYIKFLEGIK